MSDDPLVLSVTRLIEAPVPVVWRVATQRLAEWWCPKPWRVEIVEQDWRAGGRSAVVMHGPAGEAMPQEGVFLEVTPERRFVFTDAFRVGWVPQTPFMVGTMEFADEGGRTRYTGSARHWTGEDRDRHAAMGFEPGWSAVAAQLADLAESAARERS
ncbi:SRPBCC family protein [Aurantimonas sp. Leaf443]|uniref:SRPBCC family protein n=1 Tax=Aurantimonas sp. Leaf443 TaxID=1736378 RepID=UPI0006FD12F4|nr:SRPBCC family protein [Aurantimonas sp. Leaf443]KQT87479.1 ATPase [Aurantimonas sp. Leaf443]